MHLCFKSVTQLLETGDLLIFYSKILIATVAELLQLRNPLSETFADVSQRGKLLMQLLDNLGVVAAHSRAFSFVKALQCIDSSGEKKFLIALLLLECL